MHTTPKVIPRGTDTYTHSLTDRQTDTYLLEIQGFRDKLSLVAATAMAAASAIAMGGGTDNHQLKPQKRRRM